MHIKYSYENFFIIEYCKLEDWKSKQLTTGLYKSHKSSASQDLDFQSLDYNRINLFNSPNRMKIMTRKFLKYFKIINCANLDDSKFRDPKGI
ncbi:hypothetical protein BpHYR1_030660 [Brachionus plicatilis]|uniref:Uncharacterized protein n=1 Tax=Brachionus plicatilis TaxID=10195 RepID=A0A3M7QDP0_BRAPC|nr:hypothetical protein BpHYR1_030660 [Brachionus plicatilis]